MEWTNEFRDEMRQRLVALFRYALIASFVISFFMVLILGYIWLSKENFFWYYIPLILLGCVILPIPIEFAFQYLM